MKPRTNKFKLRIRKALRNGKSFKTFLTLTYDNNHLKHSGPSDIRNFVWELSNYCQEKGLYLTYAWTEDYGRKGGRIHYHMITSMKFIPRNFLKDHWRNGYVHIQTIYSNASTLDYLGKYISQWGSPNVGYSHDI